MFAFLDNLPRRIFPLINQIGHYPQYFKSNVNIWRLCPVLHKLWINMSAVLQLMSFMCSKSVCVCTMYIHTGENVAAGASTKTSMTWINTLWMIQRCQEYKCSLCCSILKSVRGGTQYTACINLHSHFQWKPFHCFDLDGKATKEERTALHLKCNEMHKNAVEVLTSALPK